MIRPLDAFEQRVIGCLVEKELSTPDSYPLTLNALVAACNQTSNREPVSRLSPGDVEAALHRLMADLLVWRDRGARVLRWKHRLDEKVAMRDRAQKAVLAELLLRGAQTPGELRARSPRMHEFAELAEVEATLRALAARGLVEELPRQPGQKERRWRQLLGSGGAAMPTARQAEADEEADAPAVHATPAEPASMSGDAAPEPHDASLRRVGAADSPARPKPASPPVESDLSSRVSTLERRVDELAAIVARLTRAE